MLDKELIAFVATGDELTQGEIANSNGQRMAQILIDHGLATGNHLICTDNEEDIVHSIQFQLANANTLIITGGLGPTTDDRTRYAVARACQQTLRFDAQAWQTIVHYFQRSDLVPHESNRQQALFPEHAEIFPNAYGTAAGFKVVWNNKTLYVLPGPPRECLPMFENHVLPELLARNIQPDYQCFRWRLFGVGESMIAPQLEALITNSEIITGYRVNEPYIDFKLRVPIAWDSRDLVKQIEKLIQPHCITQANETASERFIQLLVKTEKNIFILDEVTHGALAHRLLTPETVAHCQFVSALPSSLAAEDYHFLITGCEAYWQGQAPGNPLNLSLTVITATAHSTENSVIPYRHARVMKYVLELVCHHLYLALR